MNLKEAFRFQNKMESLISELDFTLSRYDNITITKSTYLYKKANPDAENETVEKMPAYDYLTQINKLMEFAVFLLEQREKLSYKITECKNALPIDLDSETSLNRRRRELSKTFSFMARTKSSEIKEPNAGVGYRFNNEGNQISYRCDIEHVTTINFDRNLARKYAEKLSQKADSASNDIDRVLIDSVVDYTAPFNVNANLEEAFEEFLAM